MVAPVVGISSGALVLLALVLLASGYLVVRMHGPFALRRRAPSGDAPREPLARESDLRELARELMSHLNAKMAELDAQVRAAEERIAQLEATALGAHRAVEHSPMTIGAPSGETCCGGEDTRFAAVPSSVAEKDASLARHVAIERRSATQAEALSAMSTGATAPTSSRYRLDPPRAPRPITEVYRLADEGLPHAEIARRTANTTGEVELILGLRPTMSDARNEEGATRRDE